MRHHAHGKLSSRYVPKCAADASFPGKAVQWSGPSGLWVSAGKRVFTTIIKHCIDFSKDFNSYTG